jgi:hypothetical protein
LWRISPLIRPNISDKWTSRMAARPFHAADWIADRSTDLKIATQSAAGQPAAKADPKPENSLLGQIKPGIPAPVMAPDATQALVNALLGSEEGKALLERVLLKHLATPFTPSLNFGFGGVLGTGLGGLGLAGSGLAGFGLAPKEKPNGDIAAGTAAGAALTAKEKISLGGATGATAGVGAAALEALHAALRADPHGVGHLLATGLAYALVGGAAGAAMGGGVVGEINALGVGVKGAAT